MCASAALIDGSIFGAALASVTTLSGQMMGLHRCTSPCTHITGRIQSRHFGRISTTPVFAYSASFSFGLKVASISLVTCFSSTSGPNP
jgi:hypothetical protein